MARKKYKLEKGSKSLACECGRQSYVVSMSCDKVTCCYCLSERNGNRVHRSDIPAPAEVLPAPEDVVKKELIRIVPPPIVPQKMRPPTAVQPPPKRNPVNPETGKRKRGRPPKNSI